MKKKLQLKTSHSEIKSRSEMKRLSVLEKKELPQIYSQEELRQFQENLKQSAKKKKARQK